MDEDVASLLGVLLVSRMASMSSLHLRPEEPGVVYPILTS
jgi:hypothetical protein